VGQEGEESQAAAAVVAEAERAAVAVPSSSNLADDAVQTPPGPELAAKLQQLRAHTLLLLAALKKLLLRAQSAGGSPPSPPSAGDAGGAGPTLREQQDDARAILRQLRALDATLLPPAALVTGGGFSSAERLARTLADVSSEVEDEGSPDGGEGACAPADALPPAHARLLADARRRFAVARAAVFGLSTLLVSGALHGKDAGGAGVNGVMEDDPDRPALDVARLGVVRDALMRSSLVGDVDRMFVATSQGDGGGPAQPQSGWRGPSPPNLR
jgi:hypothetical protein